MPNSEKLLQISSERVAFNHTFSMCSFAFFSVLNCMCPVSYAFNELNALLRITFDDTIELAKRVHSLMD